MRKIKAAFFDIDGTLVSLKTKVCPPSAQEALAKLRAAPYQTILYSFHTERAVAYLHRLEGVNV